MENRTKIKLDLLPAEQNRLRANKIKISDITKYSVEELSVILNVPIIRAMEIYALVEFQNVPSIGIKFAQNLISMGYYSLKDLRNKDGARLIEDLEFSSGTWIDPCVEDQFRLIVYYANTRDGSKRWWNFTEERKKYRLENGYPPNRPTKAWFKDVKLAVQR
ncbi:MAG TPA: helix-hairpin-helix domain-containing protein [Bacteroidales bacterium]|jgi:Pathogenicity locus.